MMSDEPLIVKGAPIFITRREHPDCGCVGYIKVVTAGSIGANVFVPDGRGYKVESVALFRRDFMILSLDNPVRL